MKHRRSRKPPEAASDAKPFFDTASKQPDIQHRADDNFFQPQLTINRPGDAFEQEADAVADAVVNQSQAASPDRIRKRETIRRQAAEEEEVTARFQRQEMEEEEPLQAQAEEEEEMAQAHLEVQRQGIEEEEPVQGRGMEEEEEVTARFQRQEMEEEEPLQAQVPEEEEEPVQAKARGGGTSLAARLRSNRGRGNPLPPNVRSEMEGAIGADFSGVRLHTDGEAVHMSRQLRAEAFTNGSDIYFNEGKLSPNSRSGKHLLAHELTHVVQQNKSKR